MVEIESGVMGLLWTPTVCECEEPELSVRAGLPEGKEEEGREVGTGVVAAAATAYDMGMLLDRVQSDGTLKYWGSKEVDMSAGSWSGEDGLARRFFEGPLYPRRDGVY